MWGYLSGLSAPSVTEMTTTLLCSPRSNSAGHTRLPTFSMNSNDRGCRIERLERAADHLRVEMTPRARVDLYRARSGGADTFGVEQRFLVTFDHRHRPMAPSSRIVRSSRVVLPAPGELVTLNARISRSASHCRFCSASRSFFARTFCSRETVSV